MTFASSSQCKNWTFSYDAMQEIRMATNTAAVQAFLQRQVSGASSSVEPLPNPEELVFSAHEEWLCVRIYLRVLKTLVAKFQPPLPQCVEVTALMFMKRFYLYNSVMDFHPKEVMLICLYMACKNEEFHVSIANFVRNVPRQREKYADIIVRSELFVIQRLKYDLAIYSCFIPAKGLLLAFCHYLHEEEAGAMSEEGLQRADVKFQAWHEPLQALLHEWHLTDVPLVAAPSQMALAGIYKLLADLPQPSGTSSSSNEPSESGTSSQAWLNFLERFVKHSLCHNDVQLSKDLWAKLQHLTQIADEQNARPNIPLPQLEAKLSRCRNPLYDVDSAEYRTRQESVATLDIASPL